MTAPSPGPPHLDLDALADVEEDLVSGEQAEVARAHLEQCEDCRARLAQLRTTRALLTALPPESMPADVAARMDAALAGAADSSATIVAMNRRSRFWNTPAIAGAAAAIAILVLVGAVVVGNLDRHHSSPSSTTAGSNALGSTAKAPAEVKEWATGTDYSAQNIAAKVPLLVLGVPPATLTPQAGAVAPAATPAPVPTTSAASTFSLTQADLRASRAAIVECGRILAGGVATTPVAVDFAKFDGKPAVVVILPAVDHPTTFLDVWVVRSTCSTASVDLFFRRVARPTG